MRSYHFFKFIKTYAKISSTGIEFFNSVIAFYIKKLFSAEYLPGYDLPKEIIEHCDRNMRPGNQKPSIVENCEFSGNRLGGILRPANKNSMNK